MSYLDHPTLWELEETGIFFECPYDHDCDDCEYDCDPEEDF